MEVLPCLRPPFAVPLLRALRLALLAALCAPGLQARAEPQDGITRQVQDLAMAGMAQDGNAARIEVQVGELDHRLRLAPCQRVEPHLLAGTRLWGRTRIGLRCVEGPVAWNVYLPITVKVYGIALAASGPMAAGRVLTDADLSQVEVDLAEDPSPAVADPALAVGRVLARSVNAGESLRESDLRARQWFAAGATVLVKAGGPGFSVTARGRALTPGVEGRPVRVRTESGRILTGQATGEGLVEMLL